MAVSAVQPDSAGNPDGQNCMDKFEADSIVEEDKCRCAGGGVTCVFGCSFVFRAWKDPGSPKARPGSDHVMRRRATLPHPIECSTIAVPGLSFRVRNGAGRLTWAMAAANLNYHPTRGHGMARGGPGTGRWTRAQPRGSSRDHHAPCRTGTDAGIPTPHQRWGV